MTNQTNQANQNKTVYLMAGAAGAGKSYTRKNHEVLSSLEVVDADQFKKAHPEYDPNNPGALHAWSSAQARRKFHNMLEGSASFIYDGTGTKAEKYAEMIDQAREAGFEAKVVYVEVSLETSLYRNANRERHVPEEIIHDQHRLIKSAMNFLKEYADGFEQINND